MSLSSHTFEFSVNLSTKEIYTKSLKAIKKLDYKLISEDKSDNAIIAKTKMEANYWGQKLTINISNKFISITAEVNQLMVSKKSREICENFVKEISKSANVKSPKKNKIKLKDTSQHQQSENKDKSQMKLVWWGIGILFIILFFANLETYKSIIFSGGGNNSTNNSGSSKGTNTGRDYIPLVSKGISENGIWGTRCYYSNGKVLEIESPRSVQIQGGWPPKCPSKY